jgi:hypothetical protein
VSCKDNTKKASRTTGCPLSGQLAKIWYTKPISEGALFWDEIAIEMRPAGKGHTKIVVIPEMAGIHETSQYSPIAAGV